MRNPFGTSAVAPLVAAAVLAVLTYVAAAMCAGWIVSILLEPLGYDWPRFAAEAAASTALGMIASRRVTDLVFPRRSGKGVFAAFAGVVLLVSLAGGGRSANWLHTGQALLLVALAYGLFWPRRRRAP